MVADYMHDAKAEVNRTALRIREWGPTRGMINS